MFCVCAWRTDAVASDRLTCPVGVLHVYFISSSIAEVSPHPVFLGHCARVIRLLRCVFPCVNIHISMHTSECIK